MSTRAAGWLAWSMWAFSIVLTAGGLFFMALNYPSLSALLATSFRVTGVAPALTFATVGALIASRRPDNRIGWLLSAEGLIYGTLVFAGEYAQYTLLTAPGRLPAGVWLAWLAHWVWLPGISLLMTFLLLLFPNGRLPSPRWRPLAWLSAVITAHGSILTAVNSEPLYNFPSVSNPVGFLGDEGLLGLIMDVDIPSFVVPLIALACLTSLIVRYHRASGQERQQIKWFVYAASLTVVAFGLSLAGVFGSWGILLVNLTFLGLPIAMGIAILRYRLYDIDIIINRTLVYGTLTGLLALIYFGSVVVLQGLFRSVTGQESNLAIVIATLVSAALFQPLRHRLQIVIDRRFYRSRYDAARTLAAFNTRLRDEVDLATLTDELVRVVDDTLQPSYVSLWLLPTTGGSVRVPRE